MSYELKSTAANDRGPLRTGAERSAGDSQPSATEYWPL